MRGTDEAGARYKLHLPTNFSCGCVFFELRQGDADDWKALDAMVDGLALKNFWGGVILRGEGHTQPSTARIGLTQSESAMERAPEQSSALLKFGLGASRKLAEKLHIGTMLHWSEMGFAQFGFDLIALMRGTYEAGRLSSWHGFGSAHLEEVRAKNAET
jgi:hypothetical protein